AKIGRVEPTLQGAFVEYGGVRQGFLAFDEIHPDYYQLPVDERQRLIEETEAHYRSGLPMPRRYKIGDVIKRRQVVLVQLLKIETDADAAVLTTYLSLAGRFLSL